jgi:hypothetical protein
MAINIEEYINENEDELIDNDYSNNHEHVEIIEQGDNEDTEDDEFNDMLHDEYEKKLSKKNVPDDCGCGGGGGGDGYGGGGCGGGGCGGGYGDEGVYYFNLLNIFIKYYNDKYNKNENFFTNIKDIDKDTTPQMELFYEMIIEYNLLKEDVEGNKGICDKEDVHKLIKNPKYQQVYCLELPNKECIYSPSLLICLNYLIEHNNSDITDCKIYFLK